MATANGTIVSQCGYNGGWFSYGSGQQYAGYNSGNYYPYILQFTTPSFTGVSEKIDITFQAVNVAVTSASIRYALCTSDANKNSYTSTTSDVEDSYKIASGTFSVSCPDVIGTSNTLTINTSTLQPDTTYYLYFWGNGTTTSLFQVGKTSNHSVTLTYDEGVVYIYNGSSWDKYAPYIYNGSSWDKYAPYVYNGSSWDRYG